MNRIGFGQNISVLRALRSLDSSSSALARVNERLASGQRINRAADDAAGLAISQGLSASSRIYGQGIRNFNDGISLLNVADGALDSLQNILIRQQELASQAASGTLASPQRLSLNAEFTSLRNEYNRLISSTTFNGLHILDGSSPTITLQGGPSLSSSLRINLTAAQTVVGTGTYSSNEVQDAGNRSIGLDAFAVGDINGDGRDDFVGAWVDPLSFFQADLHLVIGIGQGDGNFTVSDSIIDSVSDGGSASFSGVMIGLGDADADGKIDIAMSYDTNTSSSSTPHSGFLKGDGTGNFDPFADGDIGSITLDTRLGVNQYTDVNGDGVQDYMTATGSQVFCYKQNTQLVGAQSISQDVYSISTASNSLSAMTYLDGLRVTVANARGDIGGSMSRVSASLSAMLSMKENLDAAHARITDVDVAQEAGQLARLQILQKVSTAVLAQANLEPRLLLQLLA